MTTFQEKEFTALTVKELYAILALRADVFVVEQNCVYQDVDGKDPLALHIIGSIESDIVAYARVFAQGIAYSKYASIGRIVTSSTHRGKNIGNSLVAFAIEQCINKYPWQNIKISAQAHLEKFYIEHGFIATGEAYLEDGIPHIEMILEV